MTNAAAHPTLETRCLLAGAYKGKAAQERAFLTHVVNVATGRALCGGVKPDSVCDAGAGDVNAVASCPRCAAKDPRGGR